MAPPTKTAPRARHGVPVGVGAPGRQAFVVELMFTLEPQGVKLGAFDMDPLPLAGLQHRLQCDNIPCMAQIMAIELY